MIKYLKDEDFRGEVNKDLVLVDFYADWCGPCKAMGEVLETVEGIEILKINTDQHQDIATQFGVMSIPTIVLFKDGVAVAKNVGFMNKDMLIQWIEQNK